MSDEATLGLCGSLTTLTVTNLDSQAELVGDRDEGGAGRDPTIDRRNHRVPVAVPGLIDESVHEVAAYSERARQEEAQTSPAT